MLARAGGAVSARADWRPNRFLEPGFAAPANKTLLLLLNGLVAKVGLRKARRAGRADLLDRA